MSVSKVVVPTSRPMTHVYGRHGERRTRWSFRRSDGGSVRQRWLIRHVTGIRVTQWRTLAATATSRPTGRVFLFRREPAAKMRRNQRKLAAFLASTGREGRRPEPSASSKCPPVERFKDDRLDGSFTRRSGRSFWPI